MRQPEEWRRVYGTTVVYVAAADGGVLLAEDALRCARCAQLPDNLYPIHTGEVGGLAGPCSSLAMVHGCFTMLVLGLGLWWIGGDDA